jgi:hypothetical protein
MPGILKNGMPASEHSIFLEGPKKQWTTKYASVRCHPITLKNNSEHVFLFLYKVCPCLPVENERHWYLSHEVR